MASLENSKSPGAQEQTRFEGHLDSKIVSLMLSFPENQQDYRENDVVRLKAPAII